MIDVFAKICYALREVMTMAKDAMTTCTVRIKSEDYAVFSAICALRNSAVTDVLRNYVYEYIDANKSILTDATERLNSLASEAKK